MSKVQSLVFVIVILSFALQSLLGCKTPESRRKVIFDLSENYFEVKRDGFIISHDMAKEASHSGDITINSERATVHVPFRVKPEMALVCRTKEGTFDVFALDDPKAPTDSISRFWILSRSQFETESFVVVSAGTKSQAESDLSKTGAQRKEAR